MGKGKGGREEPGNRGKGQKRTRREKKRRENAAKWKGKGGSTSSNQNSLTTALSTTRKQLRGIEAGGFFFLPLSFRSETRTPPENA